MYVLSYSTKTNKGTEYSTYFAEVMPAGRLGSVTVCTMNIAEAAEFATRAQAATAARHLGKRWKVTPLPAVAS